MELTTLAWCLALAAGVLIGFAKTGVPGTSLPAIAMMAVAFPDDTRRSVGVILLLVLTGDIPAVLYYRKHCQWGKILKLFPYVALGMVPAYFLLGWATGDRLRPILGVLVLGLLVLDFCRGHFKWEHLPHSQWFITLMGGLAGFATMVGNAAGPIMTIYCLALGFERHAFIGTFAWFFFIVNLVKVGPFVAQEMITIDSLLLGVKIIPMVLLGAALGVYALPRISQVWFNRHGQVSRRRGRHCAADAVTKHILLTVLKLPQAGQ